MPKLRELHVANGGYIVGARSKIRERQLAAHSGV
jgi:hypothetical protein